MPDTLHLVCNAHLDPVWLWPWEEGLAETLSTFRTAARLCEEFDGFIFNHNEAILYKWVEEYEPDLFYRIQNLVKRGKWHIMGGWVLQPDCNMPSGESLVRQILLGKLYFLQKFGVEPKTAVNLDSFGHTRGLVQILTKAGYTSYLFCRPGLEDLSLPADDFIWIGYDNSRIIAHRARHHYNSQRGKAGDRINIWLSESKGKRAGLLLWGIGNHGGGPSEEDLREISRLIDQRNGFEIRHSTPEDYFSHISGLVELLSTHSDCLNPWAVGCYTTMAQVKQKHRHLENVYYSTEKMVTNAAIQGIMVYPYVEFREALEDLLFCEFHDILPGSSIREVETYALQRMDHGMDILSRLKVRAFFGMVQGEMPAGEGEYPLFVYNPHPFSVQDILTFEFQPQEQNFNSETFWVPEMTDSLGNPVPMQLEKESSNISCDQRKRVAFYAELNPNQMNRFTCRLRDGKRQEIRSPNSRLWRFKSDECEVVVNRDTGLIDEYRIGNTNLLLPGSFQALVMKDYPDPWGMNVRKFRELAGSFSLMSPEECREFAGVQSQGLDPVRIIEDGPLRTIVEGLFKYHHSFLSMRIKIPRMGKEIEVELLIYWNEKDRMLKLSVPTTVKNGRCLGQVAYGVEEFQREKEELVAQKWIGVFSIDHKHALTIVNIGTHGFDFFDGEIRISLLRSPAYSGHPVDDETPIVPQDRLEPRIDQGERKFNFWINGGDASRRLFSIDREALVKNEVPMALVYSPSGKGKKVLPGISLSDRAIQVTAVKLSEKEKRMVIRLFEPTGLGGKTCITIPFFGLSYDVSLEGFEIKTLAIDLSTRAIYETDLMERELEKKAGS